MLALNIGARRGKIVTEYTCGFSGDGVQVTGGDSGVPRGEVWGVQTPSSPEIPKALQNHAKLNPICENC